MIHNILRWHIDLSCIGSILYKEHCINIEFKDGGGEVITRSIKLEDGYLQYEQEEFDKAYNTLIEAWKKFSTKDQKKQVEVHCKNQYQYESDKGTFTG